MYTAQFVATVFALGVLVGVFASAVALVAILDRAAQRRNVR